MTTTAKEYAALAAVVDDVRDQNYQPALTMHEWGIVIRALRIASRVMEPMVIEMALLNAPSLRDVSTAIRTALTNPDEKET